MVVSNICYFHPYLGKWSNLTNIFQGGWNHQLVHLYNFDMNVLHQLKWLKTLTTSFFSPFGNSSPSYHCRYFPQNNPCQESCGGWCGEAGFMLLFERGRHEKINPKDWQVLSSLGEGFLQFFRVVSSDYGKPHVGIDKTSWTILRNKMDWKITIDDNMWEFWRWFVIFLRNVWIPEQPSLDTRILGKAAIVENCIQ